MSTLDLTEWRVIPQYPDYAVSSSGLIKRVVNIPKAKAGRIIKPSPKASYLGVGLWVEGKLKQAYVHRLVALAFVENPHNYPCVRHLDGDKLNNAASNLAWGTHAQNMQDMIGHGRTTRGTKMWMAKLSEQGVRDIRSRYTGEKGQGRRLAKEYGVTPSLITCVLKRKCWDWLD